MIRHIYDPSQTTYPSSPITDLMFHVNVFAAADKYDVPCLRVLVVKKFPQLMDQKWSTSQQEFCTVVQRLCGPAAARFADPSLQKATAAFCLHNTKGLIKSDAFVSMLEGCGPFAARLLTSTLRSQPVMETYRCLDCISNTGLEPRSYHERRCFTCNTPRATMMDGRPHPSDSKRFKHYKSFMELQSHAKSLVQAL